MSSNFQTPQRQSKIGVLLIFATALFKIVRNFWVLGVYLLVQDFERNILVQVGIAILVLLVGALIYSLRYYQKFLFYIDLEKEEFVLEHGVVATNITSIPFNRIQQVNFKRNLLQRIIGLYSLQVDTAGSKEKEVEIKALSREKADELAERLMQLSGREKKKEPELAEEGEETPAKATEWQYRLSFARLLKLGLTSNYFRGLALLLTFYFSLKEQYSMSEESFGEMPELFIWEITSSILLIVLLLFVGMALTVGETFIKYYGLQLEKVQTGLRVEMGLRNNTKVTVQARRIQLLQVLTNPIQRRLDMYKLKVSLGSSQDEVHKDHINIPGLPNVVVQKVSDYFFDSDIREKQWVHPHRMLLFRKISRGLLPLWIGLIFLWFSDMGLAPIAIFGIGLGYVLLMSLYQLLSFRALKLAVSEDFLVKYSGVWIRRRKIIQMYKLQSVSITEPIWYKKRNLANITFHTAAGDINFDLAHKKELVPLANLLVFKTESSNRPWM